MIIVQSVLTADNTDVLAGTDLANIPSSGQLDFLIGSTQADTEMTITGPGSEPIVRSQKVKQKTNGMCDMNTDLPLSIGVVQGGHYVLNINIITGATVQVICIFRNLLEI